VTPAERKAARELVGRIRGLGGTCIHGRKAQELLRYAADALDQIDADEQRRKDDEGLMRRSMGALTDSYAETHWVDSDLEEVLDALRARLGEPAPEEKP